MSSSIQRIGKTTAVGEQRRYQSNKQRNQYEKPQKENQDENDYIEISEEAKNRSRGKHKKTILEHLEEE